MAEIFVYKIYSTFTKPGEKGLLIIDENIGESCAVFDREPIKELVDAKKCGEKIRYEGNETKHDSYLDGYFGRLLIPAESFLLRRLNRREINRLEKKAV